MRLDSRASQAAPPGAVGNCEELSELLAVRAAESGAAPQADDFVFTAPMGGPLRRTCCSSASCDRLSSMPGFRRSCACDLRHTCLSLLIQLGAHPKAIQERLGHSSITVTMDVYGHLFPALSEALTQRLDDVFRAARTAVSAPAGGDVISLRRR